MDYGQFVRKLGLPSDFVAPSTLTYEDVVINAITRDDLADDVAGINASLDLIRETRGGRWPTEAVTEESNYDDLLWHEVEFRDHDSFTYVIRDSGGTYLGCVYLYPMGRRTKLTEELLDHDVDVSWWVTPDAYEKGYYRKLYAALQQWVTNDYPFRSPYYSNADVPS